MTARRRPKLPLPAGPLGLLIEILTDTPKLRGAACRDHPDVFAATIAAGGGPATEALAEARAAAKAICRTCPALLDCARWVDGLRPAQRPGGVAAGQVTSQWK